MGGPHIRSAWLNRLWLPFLLAAWGAGAIAPIVLGQLPSAGERLPTDAVQMPRIINGLPPTLEAPVESAPASAESLPEPPPAPEPSRRLGVAEKLLLLILYQRLPATPQPQAVTPLPPPSEDLPEPLAMQSEEPEPTFQIEVAPPEKPSERVIEAAPPARPVEPVIEAATFGNVIGVGRAPAPVWIGPREDADAMPEEAAPIIELASFEAAANFCRPIAGMPGEPADDGIILHVMERTLPALPNEQGGTQESAVPKQAVVPQVWPGYRYRAPVPYRRWSQPTAAPQPRPFGSRVYEWMVWPVRVMTEPFRDF